MRPRLSSTILLAVLAAAPGSAQTFHASVRGSVRDATGIVRGAAVQLTEETTGLSASTVTNDAGEFAFDEVPPGTYRVRASASGFKTTERSGIGVATQASLTIDLVLEAGAVAELVTVEARTPLTESANVGAVIGRAALDTLPSAGRNVFIAATTTAMVLPTGDAQFVRQQDQSNSSLISIAGGPRRDNTYVVDGVPIVDLANRATFVPSFHAVEELRVSASDYDAENGRTSGGIFNTTSRSGANQFHGSAMYQTRPSWAQGRLYFAEQNDIPNPDGYYRLYGAGFGGPIARNRTFFWASTEGYRTDTASSTVLVLPTAAERAGDFSRAGVTIYDPLTTRPDPGDPTQFIRDPFPGNRIPANRLNPVAQAMLQYLPMPSSGTSLPAVANLVNAADQITGKVTQRWNPRLATTGLYAWYGSQEPDARYYGGALFANAADPGDGALVRRTHLVALDNTWAANDRLLVDVRYGFNRFLDDNRPAPFDATPLGFDPRFTAATGTQAFPQVIVDGYGNSGNFLGDRTQGTGTYQSQQASAVVSTLAGRHRIKAGGEFRVNGVSFLNSGGLGSYIFSADFTAGPNPNAPTAAGDAFASFLLGAPASGNYSASTPIDVFARYWAAFVQDEVRVTPSLTVTAALRYEYEQGLQERNNHMVVGWAATDPFPVQVPGLALTGGVLFAGVDGAPTHQGDPNPAQFAPRVSVTDAVAPGTVVRGGYALYWAPVQGISADQYGAGTLGYSIDTGYVATGGNPLVPCATCSLTNPFPLGVNQPIGSGLGRLTGVGNSVWFVDPGSHMPHVHRYSIDLERELPARWTVGVGYVGALGRDLQSGIGGGLNINQLDPKYMALGTALQQPVANPFLGTPLARGILAGPTVPMGQLLRPYPQFDAITVERINAARSRYDALVTRVDHRIGSGLTLRADYTWSRTEDSQFAESNFFSGGTGILDNYDVNREYGLSALDTPHRVNVAATLMLPHGVTASAVALYQSGFPLLVYQTPNNSGLFGSGQRPNIVAGVNAQLTSDPERSYDATCGCIRWLNPAAWSQAAAFTFGNGPHSDDRARTPARRNVDIALDKAFAVRGASLDVRAEVINIFNFADFTGFDMAYGDPGFGQLRSASGFPRLLQVSLRARW